MSNLEDTIPNGMSQVIGAWTSRMNISIPADKRNEWENLVSEAQSTGREQEVEAERLKLVENWFWEKVLPAIQPIAEERGFGDVWSNLCEERTEAAVKAAQSAVENDLMRSAQSAQSKCMVVKAATAVEAAVKVALNAVERMKRMERTRRTEEMERIEREAMIQWVRNVALSATKSAVDSRAAWEELDPCDLLRKLIDVKP